MDSAKSKELDAKVQDTLRRAPDVFNQPQAIRRGQWFGKEFSLNGKDYLFVTIARSGPRGRKQKCWAVRTSDAELMILSGSSFIIQIHKQLTSQN